MSTAMYELIAIGARYLFAVLMLLIVIRAWKITIVDSRRAGNLRRLSPETGVCGEFLVLNGSGKVRDGMRYPVIREGLIGSSRKADVRLRCQSVHRSHAFFELTSHGLRLRAGNGARMYAADGSSRRELMLGDGGKVTVGQVELMLVLTADAAESISPPEAPVDAVNNLFDITPEPVRTSPRPQPAAPQASAAPVDPFTGRPVPPLEGDTAHLFEAAQAVSAEENAAHNVPDIPVEKESAATDIPGDLFMENSPDTLKPETDEVWGDDSDIPVKDWDQWEEAPRKVQPQRKRYEDPFDV